MKLDFDTLYNECKRENFTSGKEVFYNDAVRAIRTTNDGGKTVISAIVKDDGNKNTSIVFDETGGLYEYTCDCADFGMEDGPCKHIVALALSYEEKNPVTEQTSDSVEKKSDADVSQLVFDYNKKRRLNVGGDEVFRAELVPYINFNDGITLSLTIGHRKQYIIKDISAFILDFHECRYRRYGVALEIYHNAGSFTEQSNKLIKFIEKCLRERGADYTTKTPSSLTLTGGEFDQFFMLYEGKLVNRTKSEHWAFTAVEAEFPVRFSVKKGSGGYLLKMNCVAVDYHAGRDYVYAAIGNRIFRLEEDIYEGTNELITSLRGGRELFIAENDFVQFYNAVLKKVDAFTPVTSDEVDLKQFETPALTCKIYIKCVDKCLILEVQSSYNGEEFDMFKDNYSTDHLRDWEAEDSIRTILSKYFPSYPSLEIADDDAMFEFLKSGVRELCAYSEVFMTDSMEKMRIRNCSRMRVGVRLHSDVLSLSLESDEYSAADIQTILNAYRDKKRYVLLGGGFVDLDDRSLDAISGVLKDAEPVADGEYTLPSYYASFVGEELRDDEISFVKDDGFDNLIKDFSSQNDDVSLLPEKVGSILRGYQKIGFNWLYKLSKNGFGGILADDMGLGKTLQVIALLCVEKCSAIIICPTTLLLNWQEEIEKFAPWLKTIIVMGAQPDRKQLIEAHDNYDVVITSYDLIRRDGAQYADIEFDYAVADEAQNIKNPETKNAQAVKSLRARHKFALTGTPVENHLGELWSIFDFVMPGFLGSYQSFRENFEEGIVAGDEDCADKFKKLIMPFVLRRLKTDVLKELPPKIESKLTVMLEGEQKSLYAANMHILKHSLDVTDSPNRVEVLSMIMRLRELCCSPSLVYPDYNGNSAKLESCMELIASAVEGGHKVLLFSQFTSMLDIIKKRLAEQNVSFYLLTGENPKTERLQLVKKFNTDDTNVFLISLKAGGTGLNLTGADIVIHYDPWWNESVMNQATDRAYRIGQDKSVHVYKLILGDTLEERIYDLQQRKSALSNMVVGSENNLKDIIKLIREQKED